MDSTALDGLINDFLSRYNVPGISVGIARQGFLLCAAGYGFANLEHRAPATPNTLYQTASVGKQFTAALVLLLAERSVLRLDDSIASHFPKAPADWNSISVRHLLTHTSGISDEGYSKLNLRLD
jgi:CubicO group peptidase (beta-lactamase class C family)